MGVRRGGQRKGMFYIHPFLTNSFEFVSFFHSDYGVTCGLFFIFSPPPLAMNGGFLWMEDGGWRSLEFGMESLEFGWRVWDARDVGGGAERFVGA